MPDAVPINRDTVEARLVDLTNAVRELDQLAALPAATFLADAHQVALASFYLQRALEDVLGIGTHLLARLPSPVTVEEYRHVLPELAKAGIVSLEFAERNAKLGSYRNRLEPVYSFGVRGSKSVQSNRRLIRFESHPAISSHPSSDIHPPSTDPMHSGPRALTLYHVGYGV